MNKTKPSYLYCFFFILFIWEIGYSQVRIPKINIEDFSGTKEQVNEKITALETLIAEAETNGIDATKEKMGISLANIFSFYADWDENNISTNEELYSNLASFHQTTAQNLANNLPAYERAQIIEVLDEGITTLNALIAGEITRKTTPVVDWSKITYDGNQQIHNGKPVFLADYTWQKDLAGTHDVTEYFGAYDSYYVDPMHVIAEDGSIPNWMSNDLLSKPDGNFGIMFFGHSRIPNWLKTKYPDIETGLSHYTRYDIGNPGAKEVFEKLCAGVLPLIKGKNYTKQGYMLTNEPHWNLSGNWEVVQFSEHTKDSLRTWLEDKHGTIANLNTQWQKTYSSFDDVDVASFPMSGNEQGTPMWYDVMKFNQHRVTNWFQFLHNEVKKYDPEANTHIKLIPFQWSGNARYNGLDFEALTNITSHIGNDGGSRNSYRWGGPQTWEDRYSYFWRDFSMTYDFFKSVAPNKVNYNSEAHFIQTTAFADLFLDTSYVRSVYWQAVLQGMNSAQTWFWPKEADGGYRNPGDKAVAGSLVHQPRVVNEITSTFMDLNAHSENIAALQHLRQSIRIFHSETSAINKGTHMDQIFELYESLYFEGMPIGFATKKIIESQNNSNWDVILINRTEFITIDELTAIQNYLDNGGTVIIDPISLKKNEYGINHSQSLNTNNGGVIISAASLSDFTTKALELIDNKGKLPNVTVEETNTHGKKGCFWRSYKNDDGKEIFNIINIGKTEAAISLSLKGVPSSLICINQLTGETMNANFTMQPESVYLLEVKERTAQDNRFTISTTSETCTNKNNGQISIVADFEQNYTATFNNVDTNFTNQLTMEDIAPGTYELCIKAANEATSKCYNIEIKEAQTITGKTSLKSKTLQVNIEEGTAPYEVIVNNETIYQTNSQSFSIDINNGDFVQVKTSKDCEGLIEKTIDLFGDITAYPNPSTGLFEIETPITEKYIGINLYSIQSQLMSTKVYPIQSGKVQLNIEDFPNGIYFAKILLKKPVNIKLIKK